jgi:hypothetical protein
MQSKTANIGVRRFAFVSGFRHGTSNGIIKNASLAVRATA